jgi:hypothetical protein
VSELDLTARHRAVSEGMVCWGQTLFAVFSYLNLRKQGTIHLGISGKLGAAPTAFTFFGAAFYLV